jgi:hypothetical protein
MYEVLTGERLFVHAGLTTSADEIYSQPIPQISRKVPGLTPDLDQIMTRALSLSPDARYQTAGELNEALTRCAHRNGLLMAAPELAEELLAACGPVDQWRGDDDDDDDLGYVARAGTEVYDAVDDEDLDEAADDDLSVPMAGPVSIHSIAARANEARAAKVAAGGLRPDGRPKTEVGKFAGVELTSIINMMDIEGAPDGARPLVDLNVGPKLDSGPRLMDSGPSSLPRDPLEMMPTAPRQMPALPPRPNIPMPLTPPVLQRRPDQPRERPRSGTPKKRSLIRPWMVIAVILIAAGIAAITVAMSGPDVPTVQTK